MKENQNSRLTYILYVSGRMFVKDDDRTDRPKNGKNFSFLHLVFICRNSNKEPSENEPVIGEIDATRHSPVYRAIDKLVSEGWMELSEEEAAEIISTYAPGLKTVPVMSEYE